MTETNMLMKCLFDAPARNRLLVLREKVTPILAINLLPHYTDHSVKHSDSMTQLIDQLVGPIQGGPQKLTEEEAAIVYTACYLHDIGMNWENPAESQCVRQAMEQAGLGPEWADQAKDTQLDLIRRHHHQLSAELVIRSGPSSANPPLGVRLTDDYNPGYVACLCEAHCLETDTARYQQLTEDRAGVRMGLLSAVLRVADILDESRPRAERVKARLLELDLESQTHWWRHYYVEKVTFDDQSRVITIWFAFPLGSFNEYKGIVPQLQIPAIESEIAHHQRVFNQYGLGWSVEFNAEQGPYPVAEAMPEDVLTEMLKEISHRKASEAESHRQIVLQQFKESQPLIRRRLKEIAAQENSLGKSEHLRKVAELAVGLWGVGGKRSGWCLLNEYYNRHKAGLNDSERLQLGLQLAGMMLEDDSSRSALDVLQETLSLASRLPADDSTKAKFYKAWARCLVDVGNYDEAASAIQQAIALATSDGAREELRAELAELHLMHGRIDEALRCLANQGGGG